MLLSVLPESSPVHTCTHYFQLDLQGCHVFMQSEIDRKDVDAQSQSCLNTLACDISLYGVHMHMQMKTVIGISAETVQRQPKFCQRLLTTLQHVVSDAIELAS